MLGMELRHVQVYDDQPSSSPEEELEMAMELDYIVQKIWKHMPVSNPVV
jgi:hypothetical protein